MALGIIFVVMGHNYQPPIFLLPAYTFQVALFFFVSGYFFKVQLNLKDKLLWLKKKAINLLGPYFIYNIFYAALTYYLITRGVNLGQKFTWHNFFIEPFVSGQSYFLYLAAWFVPQLFLTHLVAQILIWRDSKIYKFIVLGLSLLGAIIFIDKYTPAQGAALLVLGRTAFALFFYLLGQVLKTFATPVKNIMLRPETFFIIYLIYVSLASFGGAFNYSLAFADFAAKAFATITGTIAAISLIYIISEYLAQNLSDNNWLLKIGQNTFSIMANHLLIFFIINYVFYKLALIPASALSNVFFHYQVEKTWFVYLILGVGLPLLFSLSFTKIKNRILVKS